jgi:hypothetical protein
MQGRRLEQPPKGNLTVSNKCDIILTYKRVGFQVSVSETFAWIFTSPGDFVFWATWALASKNISSTFERKKDCDPVFAQNLGGIKQHLCTLTTEVKCTANHHKEQCYVYSDSSGQHATGYQFRSLGGVGLLPNTH